MSTHSEWIQHLLDGELDTHVESPLFAELAMNADLRAEFKQQLAIRAAVQNDRLALVPPAALTNSVFSGLGFAAPLAGAAAGAAGGGLLAQWLTRLGLPFVTAIAAAGISVAVSGDSSSSAQVAQQQSPTEPAGITGVTPALPAPAAASAPSSATAMNTMRTEYAERTRTMQERIDALERQNQELNGRIQELQAIAANAQQEIPHANAESAMFVEPSVSTVNLTRSFQMSRNDGGMPVRLTALSSALTHVTYPGYSLQTRGITSTPLTTISAPAQTEWYDNVGLAVLFHLSERHTVGLEVGNEAFPQVFEGKRASQLNNPNAQIVRYEQQPSATWAGLTYRHSLPAFGQSGVAPFAQALVGGTKYGPLGRLSAGFTYSPSGPLSFIVGLEGTMLAYPFQSTWFTSSKLAFTYGIAVRL